MLFNSYIFILLFLPLTLIGYYGLNRFDRNTLSKLWLLGMSLWFYGYFNVRYLPIIVCSIGLNYLCGRVLLHSASDGVRKAVFAVALTLNLGCLVVFKYLGFFTETVNAVFMKDFFVLRLVLPLGISFFTFQQVSYIVDMYRRKVPDYPFLDYALFVSFFPQLIAGPIVLHSEIIPQFCNKENLRFNSENFSKGVYAFAFGLAKKVLVADTVAGAVNLAFSDTDYFLNTTNGLLVMLAYTIQIYFDFSGYCDMSTGLGLMFNIKIPMNFNSPYRALDIVDFWKRWHITLTRFFTTYVYIPLGGNRKGKFRTYLNNLITFLISGLWHGANHTFVLWGGIHGTAIILNKICKKPISKIPNLLRWFVTFGFVNVTWLLFRADSVRQFLFIGKRFLLMHFEPVSAELIESMTSVNLQYIFDHLGCGRTASVIYACMLLISCIVVSVLCKNTNEKLETFRASRRQLTVSLLLIGWSILSLSGVSTFLYFNF